MFKDYEKYLSKSLEVYSFVLIIIFILKIVGLDYFGLDVDNATLLKISNYVSTNWLGDIINFVTLYIQFYFYLCLVCKKEKLHLWALVGTIINFLIQMLLYKYDKLNWIYQFVSIVISLIIPIIIKELFKSTGYILAPSPLNISHIPIKMLLIDVKLNILNS